MKSKALIFLSALGVLAYLAFVDNIAINIGDDSTYISQDEWYEANNSSLNNYCENSSEETSGLIDLNDFNLYLTEMGATSFYRHDISYHDTTGDGQKEEVHSIVSLTGGGCKVTNYIEKNDKVIWQDEVLITKEVAASYTQSSKFVDTYGPYALFYLGQVASHFTERIERNNLFYHGSKLKQRSLSHSNALKPSSDKSTISESIKNYSGMYLFRMNDGLEQIYMWNSETAEFVCIHENEYSLT